MGPCGLKHKARIDRYADVLPQVGIVRLDAYRTKDKIERCAQRASPQIITTKNAGCTVGRLSILSQGSNIEFAFQPIAKSELCHHGVAIEQMDVLRRSPCHLPRQIAGIGNTSHTILIDDRDSTAEQEPPPKLRNQVESGREPQGPFAMEGHRTERIFPSIVQTIIRMKGGLQLKARSTSGIIATVVCIHRKRCEIVQEMI